MNDNEWIIGIDGGGTKCRAVLYNAQGSKLAESVTGPANIFADFDGALHSIQSACEQALDTYNLANKHQPWHPLTLNDCTVSAGCAGAGVGSAYERFVQWQHPFKQLFLRTDIHFSCMAANMGQSCCLIIVGTGSCIAFYEPLASVDKVQQTGLKLFGGHGFLLGDIASGAWLGKKAVSWFLQALESPTHDRDLFDIMASRIGTSVSGIIEKYGRANAGEFGQLVPMLLSTQDKSIHVQDWLQQGADYLIDIVKEHANSDQSIFIDGGLAQIYKPILKSQLALDIYSPKEEASYGAYLYALSQ